MSNTTMDLNLLKKILTFIESNDVISKHDIATRFLIPIEIVDQAIQFLLSNEYLSEVEKSCNSNISELKCKFCPYASSCNTKTNPKGFQLSSKAVKLINPENLVHEKLKNSDVENLPNLA